MANSKKSKKSSKTDAPASFPVVGIGASAGGLDAIKKVIAHADKEAGFAYVVISHMAKKQPSLLAELLQRVTTLPLRAIEDGERIEKNHIYINPPGKEISLYGGKFQLFDQAGNSASYPIDHFFKSLAIEKGKDAVAVVLSGTGMDGTAGVLEIKKNEGLVIAQDTASAAYEGMPQSAITSGMVDKVAEPDQIVAIISSFFKNKGGYVPEGGTKKSVDSNGTTRFLTKIFTILRTQTGHDFSAYKTSTTIRRIDRRMSLNQISEYAIYLRFLQENKVEVSSLFQELLIGVTNFFRDPDSFQVLGEKIVPELLSQKGNDSSFRVWIPGCSTGEEAYSIAILIHECLEKVGRHLNVQVFATDINGLAIERARKGIYPASIATDVNETRLSRYFTRDGENYQICKSIRDSVIFSTQDVLKDAPFSKLDLLCCRNLLIYLNTLSQKKLLPLFHYTLNSGGVLMLGSSETVGGFNSLFEPLDKRWKIFRRKDIARNLVQLVDFPSGSALSINGGQRPEEHDILTDRPDFEKITKNLILEHIDPAAVLIDSDGEILFVYGSVGSFLEPPAGHPTRKLVDMARKGLRIELSAAIRNARSSNSNISRRQITVGGNGDTLLVDLHVYPQSEGQAAGGLLLVVFEKAKAVESDLSTDPSLVADGSLSPERVGVLEKELQSTRESHQCTIEELESSNEELKSTNEELQSTNEELQSTNEELESSKEEMQSLNEELQTVNSELLSKVEELSATHDDMRNLLNSTEIATIFVDNDMHIRRYTRETEKIINLIQSDIGRPLAHVVSNLLDDGMVEGTAKVLQNLIPVENEVQVTAGGWYKMRIIPYRTMENRIDGAVLTFTDIREQKKVSEKLVRMANDFEQSWDLVRVVFDMNTAPLAVIDLKGQIVIANRVMQQLVGFDQDSLIGKSLVELLKSQEKESSFPSNLMELIEKQMNFKTQPFVIQSKSKVQLFSIQGRGIAGSDKTAFRYLIRLVKNRKKQDK